MIFGINALTINIIDTVDIRMIKIQIHASESEWNDNHDIPFVYIYFR